jgi:hypothetical protein
MALSPEERFQDIRRETEYAFNPMLRIREGIFHARVAIESRASHLPEEEVRKHLLEEALHRLSSEASTGIVDRRSPAFQEFLIAIHAIFTPEQLRKFREDARPRFHIFRTLTGSATPSKKELGDSEKFFQDTFEPYDYKVFNPKNPKSPVDPAQKIEHVPNKTALAQHALESRHLRQVLTRLTTEPDIKQGVARGDLRAILRRHPEIGADIGMILLTKELLDGIEHAQEIRSGGRRVLQAIGRGIQEDMSKTFGSDLEWVGEQMRNACAFAKKNYFWGPLSAALSPLLLIFPALRATFAIPRALLLGARDAFVMTKRNI